MRGAAIAGVLALAAAPAFAREAENDWDIIVDESRQMTLAVAAYSSGQTIAVRCRSAELDVLISGLPPFEGLSRYVEATFSDGRVEDANWFTGGDGSMVFSPVPRIDARRLRQGGALQLSVAVAPEPESPFRRYAFDLPAESANLDQVLDACGAGQPDPREAMVRWRAPPGSAPNFWRRMPTPQFPEAAAAAGLDSAAAAFSCVVAEAGRLTDCRVERESAHRRYGFGQSALRALRDARVILAEEGGPEPGRLVVVVVRFQITS
ncbi:energy transducer TonB [uncultured Brevundimonas sp.]|uniref:energy transducer TonB family protein n=1 Tax=uncultured Brevundimonas sp. TaxID=213418 RepID=UPI002604BB9B|nr:energy transducer TonB [uncultured Brevundimonas sp.]